MAEWNAGIFRRRAVTPSSTDDAGRAALDACRAALGRRRRRRRHRTCRRPVRNDKAAVGRQATAESANDAENYPADAPDKMKTCAAEFGWDFPYLYDASQEVAKAYKAACTPDFYLFDADFKLVYRGRFDESNPKNGKAVTGADLKQAIANLLTGEEPASEQTPSMGCNIKWIAGNEPDYAPGL